MFKSMTGFARATSSSNLGDLNLEINSVNRRFLEVNLFLPKAFLFLENDNHTRIRSILTTSPNRLN